MALPEFVAQHGNGLGLLAVDRVGRDQAAAERGGNSHEVEAVRRHVDALYVFGEIVAGDGEIPVIGHEGVFDGWGFSNLLPLRAGQTESAFLCRGVTEAHVDHAVGSGVRIRIHEDGVDHAEDGRGGSDAEGEGEDCGQGEAGILE